MPTERAKLLELAKRCEAASGQLRGLDYLIFCAQVPVGEKAYWDPDDPKYHFTASIDAALSLVPEGWNRSFTDDPDDLGCVIGELWTRKRNAVGHAATPALALTAACLRALATENTDAPFA